MWPPLEANNKESQNDIERKRKHFQKQRLHTFNIKTLIYLFMYFVTFFHFNILIIILKNKHVIFHIDNHI